MHLWAMRHAMRHISDGQVVLIQVLSELRTAEERCREQQDGNLGPSGLAQVWLCLAQSGSSCKAHIGIVLMRGSLELARVCSRPP